MTDDDFDFAEIRRQFIGALSTETDPVVWTRAVRIIETLNGLVANPSDDELRRVWDAQMDSFNEYLTRRSRT